MPYVLFDIDGTLVRLDGVGRLAVAEAVAGVTRQPVEPVARFVDGMDFRGRTDAMLLDDIAQRFGLVVGDIRRSLYTRYVTALAGQVARVSVRPLPGVAELLALLKKRSIGVGLLTGNVRAAARVKLRPAGLEYLVQGLGGFANHGHSRVDIARHVIDRLGRHGIAPGDVVIVGDTQHDITAAQAVGARAVAVTTGWTAEVDLRAVDPDVLVKDLRDTAPILALLQSSSARLSGEVL